QAFGSGGGGGHIGDSTTFYVSGLIDTCNTCHPGFQTLIVHPEILDSLKHLYIDTGSVMNNGKCLVFDSTTRKWILGSCGSTGGTGGISKLGSPTYGLIRPNDSTYVVDTTVIMPRVDSTAGGYYPYSSNPKNYLTSIDTTNISNFSVKLRSLFSANAPIVYNSGTGKFSLDTSTAITGAATQYDVSLKLNISDTSAMLSPYKRNNDSTNSITGYTTL